MNDDYSELVISQSQLDDIFVVRYLQDLSREAVVVYLWLNMTAGTGDFDEETVKSYRVIPENKVKETLAELLGAGLIASTGDKFVKEDLKKREVRDYVVTCKAKGEAADIPGMMSDPEQHKTLAASISRTFAFSSVCYKNWWTRATPSSSLSTTWMSSKWPTGLSTSGPTAAAPAATSPSVALLSNSPSRKTTTPASTSARNSTP